ncbi:hypothetical protein Aperf_G00000095975 [Anoplocephala perfoliata]
MLECQKCRLRQVYHSLIARELSDRPAADCWGPVKPRHHLHQLARIIRAVLIACRRQRTLYRSGGRPCSFNSPLPETLLSRRPWVQRWICRCHATDLFHYLLYAADDDIYDLHLNEVDSSRSAKWVGDIFPKGQSELYRKSLSDFEKASCLSQFRTSATYPNFLRTYDDFAPTSCGLKLIVGTSDLFAPFGRRSSEPDIEAANRRWNEGYKDLDSVKHVEKVGKCVRFPKFSPVTSVHHLITYETACRHLREDRTWEFCVLDRIRGGESDDVDDEGDDSAPVMEESSAVIVPKAAEAGVKSTDEVETSICIGAQMETSSHVMSEICPHADSKALARRKRRRNRRRCRNKPLLLKSPSVSNASDLLQNISSTSFQIGTSYFQQISSLLFTKLYSESDSPVGLVD